MNIFWLAEAPSEENGLELKAPEAAPERGKNVASELQGGASNAQAEVLEGSGARDKEIGNARCGLAHIFLPSVTLPSLS